MNLIDKQIRKNLAVSEVIGTIILLVISVSAFSVVYASFFSADIDDDFPTVTLVGTIFDNNLILEHRGGESISLQTEVLMDFETGNRSSVIIEESDYMDDQDKEDGKWNMGEKFTYSLDNISHFRRFDSVDLLVIEGESLSIVMNGKVREARVADLKVAMRLITPDEEPGFLDNVEFVVSIENLGPSETYDIILEDILPEGLLYVSHSVSDGSYNRFSGIWSINYLNIGDIAELGIVAQIVATDNELPFSHLIFLIDGSYSIQPVYFDNVLQGIADALRNNAIPNIGKVELTVIQFASTNGGTSFVTPEIICHIGPKIITNNPGDSGYYLDVADDVEAINQKSGNSPIPEVLKRSADIVKASKNFDGKNHVLLDIITDGKPNMRYPSIDYPDGDLDHPHPPSITDAIAMRNYFISTLEMTTDQDEINTLAINGRYGHNYDLLRDLINYPQPGKNWPTSERGWSRLVYNSAQVEECIEFQFDLQVNGRTNEVKVISQMYTDPDSSNNFASQTVIPSPS